MFPPVKPWLIFAQKLYHSRWKSDPSIALLNCYSLTISKHYPGNSCDRTREFKSKSKDFDYYLVIIFLIAQTCDFYLNKLYLLIFLCKIGWNRYSDSLEKYIVLFITKNYTNHRFIIYTRNVIQIKNTVKKIIAILLKSLQMYLKKSDIFYSDNIWFS